MEEGVQPGGSQRGCWGESGPGGPSLGEGVWHGRGPTPVGAQVEGGLGWGGVPLNNDNNGDTYMTLKAVPAYSRARPKKRLKKEGIGGRNVSLSQNL